MWCCLACHWYRRGKGLVLVLILVEPLKYQAYICCFPYRWYYSSSIRSFEYHCQDWWYMQCHISLRTLSVKLSGSAALCGFKDNKSFLIPFLWCLCLLLFQNVILHLYLYLCLYSVQVNSSLLEKESLNCRFKMFALSSDFSGGMLFQISCA